MEIEEREECIVKLDKLTANILRADATGHDEDHSAIVNSSAIAIAVKEGWYELVNKRVIYAIARLHDIGHSIPESAKDDYVSHPNYGVEFARKILPEAGFPAEDIPVVLDGILLHDETKPWASHKPTDVKEILLIQDADNLEGLGARGIARIIDYSRRVGRPLYREDLPIARESLAENSRKSAIHNIAWHAITLEEYMNTETAKQMSKPRQTVMINYIEQFLKECNEPTQI